MKLLSAKEDCHCLDGQGSSNRTSDDEDYETSGPVAVLMTTTAASIDPELENDDRNWGNEDATDRSNYFGANPRRFVGRDSRRHDKVN